MNEANIRQILDMQSENYENRVGTTFGTFRIDDVRYNWQAHTQEWVVSCVKCGHTETVTKSVGWDWLRGKGRSRDKCKHCVEIKREIEKNLKIEKREKIENELDSYLNKEINGWVVSERDNAYFTMFCPHCGKTRKVYATKVKNGDVAKCKHENDYSSAEYIGKKYGNLTITDYIHGRFVVRCDCGREKTVKCTVLVNGRDTTCGRRECEYHQAALNYYGKHGAIVRDVGEESEKKVYDLLKNIGYKVKQTPVSQDYGVDLICIGRDRSKVAIQIKNNSTTSAKTSVHAVMEVFAGGKYYDCDKFAVVSFTGYTDNARKMAGKLGVMLCNEKCELFDFNSCYPINTKHIWVVNGKQEPMAKTFRDNGWDCKHLERFVGKTYEEVREKMESISEKREKVKIREKLGISQQMIAYRMKKMGMTFEEAISTPKVTMGRPRKQGVPA